MESKLKIGWSSKDITPQRPILLRGQFNLRVATRVENPLTLTALAIDNGEDHAIMVSIDATGVHEDIIAESRKRVAEAIDGFVPEKLFMSGTHTHTAPFAGGGGLQQEEDYIDALKKKFPAYMSIAEYTRLLVDAVSSAAREAWEKREEGYIGWGYSYAVVGENRRIRYFDNRSITYGKVNDPDFSHVEGHVDHGVYLLFTYDAARKLTGVLVNLACPAQASESGQDFVSADFWHDVRFEMRRRNGPGLFVLPQCSAAGDITPHRLVCKEAEDRMLRLKYGEGLVRPLNRALCKDIARRIADAVDDAEPWVRKELYNILALRHVHKRLELPHWNVTDEEYAALEKEVADLQKELDLMSDGDILSQQYTSLRSRIEWCQGAIERYHRPPDSVPIEMNILRLGGTAFVTVPFEYYLDYGDRIKARSPAVQTFIVQLAGPGTYYLPTERAAQGRSYGAIPASCKVAPQGGQVIVDEAVATISQLFE